MMYSFRVGIGRGSLEAALGPDDHLNAADRRVSVERMRHVDVHDVAQRGPHVAHAQAEADVPQHLAGWLHWRRRGRHQARPRYATHVEEDGRSDSEEAKGIPVGEDALFDGEE